MNKRETSSCLCLHQHLVKRSNIHFSKQREWVGLSTVGKKERNRIAGGWSLLSGLKIISNKYSDKSTVVQ